MHVCVCVWYWGLNMGQSARQALYHLNHTASPLCFSLFFTQDFSHTFAQASLRLQSSYLFFLCSWDYRCILPGLVYFLRLLFC
jgi:hypothetical protein